jgi:hypothetical protein
MRLPNECAVLPDFLGEVTARAVRTGSSVAQAMVRIDSRARKRPPQAMVDLVLAG